jgi:hypothetical protein
MEKGKREEGQSLYKNKINVFIHNILTLIRLNSQWFIR